MASASAVGSTAVFGAVHGGSSRYRTGSHVDIDGVTLVTGAVTRTGGLMLAGFVEAGWASSEDMWTAAKETAITTTTASGGGALHVQSPLYLDASLRFGTASTEFSRTLCRLLGPVRCWARPLRLDARGRGLGVYARAKRPISMSTPAMCSTLP